MNKFIIVLIAIISISFFIKQKKNRINWNELESFEIFVSIEQKDFVKLELSELSGYPTHKIELGKIKPLLLKFEKNSDIWLWKGEKFAIAKFKNGSFFKLKISWYGGFLTILDNKQSYKLSIQSDVNEWQNVLNY
jgi:hypothetical protein